MYRITLKYQPLIPRLIALLAVVCAVCAFAYGVLLLETVAHAASSDSAERQMQALSEKTSALEQQYLMATQSLTPDRAAALGYVAPASVATVFIGASDKLLTLADK